MLILFSSIHVFTAWMLLTADASLRSTSPSLARRSSTVSSSLLGTSVAARVPNEIQHQIMNNLERYSIAAARLVSRQFDAYVLDTHAGREYYNTLYLNHAKNGRLDELRKIRAMSDRNTRLADILDHSKAFQLSSKHGQLNIVKFFLEETNVDPADDDNNAIQQASKNGHLDIVRLLIVDPRVDPSDNEDSAIQLASAFGHTEIVRLLLLDSRVDPTTQSNEPLLIASSHGHLEVVRLFIKDSRVDPSFPWNWAIIDASSKGHLEVVRLLIADPRVDPSDCGNSAIQGAKKSGHHQVVDLLLTHPKVKLEQSFFSAAGSFLVSWLQ
jgi:hypothetical protein